MVPTGRPPAASEGRIGGTGLTPRPIVDSVTLLFILFVALPLLAVATVVGGVALLGQFLGSLSREHAKKLRADRLHRDQLLENLLSTVARDTEGTVDGRTVRGVLDGHPLTVRFVAEEYGSDRTVIRLEQVQTDVGLGANDFLSRMGGQRETGDRAFDDGFRLLGGPDAIGHFDHELRARMVQGRISATCDAGRLTLGTRGLPKDTDALRALIHLSRDVARAMERPPALAERITADPDPLVRRRLLAAWSELHPDDPSPIEGALDDPDPGVRLHAATLLGRGDVHLDVLCDPGVPRSVRHNAVDTLGNDHLAAAARQLGKAPVDRHVWGRLLRRITPDDIPAVQALEPWLDALRTSNDARRPEPWAVALAAEVARRLSQLPDDGISEEVFRDLLSWPDHAPKEAALLGLRRIGSVDSVPALSALRDDLGPLDRALRTDVDDTIRTIQARASGDVGGVSLAPREGGGLAMVDSLPEREVMQPPPKRRREADT